MVRNGSLVSDKIAMLERKTTRGGVAMATRAADAAADAAAPARPPPRAPVGVKKKPDLDVAGMAAPINRRPATARPERLSDRSNSSASGSEEDSGTDSGSVSGSGSGGSSMLLHHVVGSQRGSQDGGAGSPGADFADNVSMSESDQESDGESLSSSDASGSSQSSQSSQSSEESEAAGQGCRQSFGTPCGTPFGTSFGTSFEPASSSRRAVSRATSPYHWTPSTDPRSDQLPKLTRDPAIVLRKPPPGVSSNNNNNNNNKTVMAVGAGADTCGSCSRKKKTLSKEERELRRRAYSSHESLLRRSGDEDSMSRSAPCSGSLFGGHPDDLHDGHGHVDGRATVIHGSLDRRRHGRHRQHRDAKARSAMVEEPPWCCGPPAHSRTHHCGCHHCPPPPLCAPCGGSHRACTCYPRHNKGGDASTEDRIRRLQAENERLQLQTAVLSERIDVQVDKIAEQDAGLAERKRALLQADDQLQREMLSRSSLETQKLELLSSVTELKRQLVALSRENAELRALLPHRPPVAPRTFYPSQSQLLRDASPGPGSPLHRNTASPGLEHAESCREIRELTRDIPPPRTPPASYRHRVTPTAQYHSLPRDLDPQAEGCSPLAGEGAPPTIAATNGTNPSANGNGTSTNNGIHIGKKGVVFADAERVSQEESDRSLALSLSPQPSPSLSSSKTKGIKKILGRMKRSGSGNLDDIHNEGEFRRGGVRATAGGRLGWSSSSNALSSRSQLPFAQWDREAISEWLCSLGLEHSAQEGQGWIVSGAQLLSSSPHDLEKELGLKNPLHKKKLRLALQERTDTGLAADPPLGLAGHLDTCWTLRWLDDIGLPQLKDHFSAARIDGRMLHRLTYDDLATLHVTSLLHVLSVRTGIQVLRDHRFDPNCLVRRSAPSEDIENMDEKKNGENGLDNPEGPNREVVLWTNHRVMEWLRVVDLAEYAPNLRGSGVHGGLMVHEPRFTAELLASLLSIPPSKTLLRRHLSTHFKELLGKEAIQAKRQAEASLGSTPLTPTAKIKVPKKSQFSLKRQKTKSEVEFGDLVCPLESCPISVVDISSGDRGVGDGTKVAGRPKLSVACLESDGHSKAQDSHSGRISTV